MHLGARTDVEAIPYRPQTVLYYSWIPLIVFIGMSASNPRPSIIKCVDHCCHPDWAAQPLMGSCPSVTRLISPLA